MVQYGHYMELGCRALGARPVSMQGARGGDGCCLQRVRLTATGGQSRAAPAVGRVRCQALERTGLGRGQDWSQLGTVRSARRLKWPECAVTEHLGDKLHFSVPRVVERADLSSAIRRMCTAASDAP